MNPVIIDYYECFTELKNYVKGQKFNQCDITRDNNGTTIKFLPHEVFYIPYAGWSFDQELEISNWIDSFDNKAELDALIFGKDSTERIVSCEVNDSNTELFIEHPDRVEVKVIPNKYWILSSRAYGVGWMRMKGNLHYQYGKQYETQRSFYNDKKKLGKGDIFSVSDPKESAMILSGFTYYKGLKVQDVSVLSFDIESTGLNHDDTSKVLLISNTFRKNGQIIRKLFAYDEYDSEAGLFEAWCEWVREVNPSTIVGHNIFMYDLPYMAYCADQAGTSLRLGRNGSSLRISNYESDFRYDGSQAYKYKRCNIYGREIVDTMFLSMKYDFGRKYASYGLKYIVAFEGLEVKDRVFYDAGSIRENYTIPEEWEKIKQYAEHDADDSLALFDLMIPAYFYYSQSIPKPFQSVMYSASGSQINSFLIRSYIQNGYSLPQTSAPEPFEGAISMGNPGVYHNVFKVDVASLYPSIMLQYNVYDKDKDPQCNFSRMVNYFTEERLRNKKSGKETGDRYYKDLEQAQKIVINSAYGMLGAHGLLFNSPKNAALVTLKGREILQVAIDWATSNGFQIVNADTDSISFVNKNLFIDEEQRKDILVQINSLYPDKIRFEDDGYFKHVLVIKTKNYVLDNGKKITTKGSALKATTKEIALKEFINSTITHLFDEDFDSILNNYNNYVKEIFNIKDISRWVSRKTITEKVMKHERTTELKVFTALEESEEDHQVGDKIYCYFDKDKNLKLKDMWNNDHSTEALLKKLYDTVCVFDTVLDIDIFKKYHLKSHATKCVLSELLGNPVPEKVKRPRKKKELLLVS